MTNLTGSSDLSLSSQIEGTLISRLKHDGTQKWFHPRTHVVRGFLQPC